MNKADTIPLRARSGIDTPWLMVEIGLALVTAFVIGSRYVVHRGLTLGYFLSFLLAPLWMGHVRRLVSARILYALVLVGIASGVLLQWWNSQDHQVDTELAIINTVEILGVVSCAGAMLWVVKKVGVGWALVSFGLAMVIFVDRSSDLYDSGPWRYGYALPVTIVALGLSVFAAKRWFEFLAVAVLTVAAIATGARSVFGILLLTGVMLVIHWARGRGLRRRSSVLLTGGVIVALAASVLMLGQAMMLDGYLGEQAQERTTAQVNASGSVLLGGRPELGATIALLVTRVWGMGLGILPNWSDIQTGRSGMAAIGYDPLNGYVDNYMFGEGFRLHSMFGDLWASFGIVGLLLVALILWMCVKTLSIGSGNLGDAAMYFVTFQTMWNAFFAPWYSGILVLILFLALAWNRFDELETPGELVGIRNA